MTISLGPSALHSGSVSLEELRGSLEAGLDVDDLLRVGRLLGLADKELGPVSTRSALAAGLVERCARLGALEALCDMAAHVRPSLGDRLRNVLPGNGEIEPLRAGDLFAGLLVERRLGWSALSSVLCVRQDDVRKRLKLILPGAPVRRGDIERWLAATRAASALDHPALPSRAVAFSGDAGPAPRFGVLADWLESDPLSERWAEGDVFELSDVWPVLRPVLEALLALHAAGLVHGGVSASNVLVESASSGQRVVLVDSGFYHVERPVSAMFRAAWADLAPEQIEGAPPTARTDVYAFGALLYRALAGRSAFAGPGFQTLLDKLSRDPEPLSFVAPRGSVIDELDELLLELLDRDPARRPASVAAVLEVMESLVRLSDRRDSVAPDSQFDARLTNLLENPSDDVAAAVLESAVDRGVAAERVAEAFHLAAEQARDAGDDVTAKRLLVRAATLYETAGGGAKESEETYELLLRIDPNDESAKSALIRLYRTHRNFDRLAELLLERAERSHGGERARAFAELGAVFVDQLGDREQAIVAYAHAVAAKPEERLHVERVEALAGDRDEAWEEVFAVCGDAVADDLAADHRHSLLCQLGRWYVDRAHRPDLALKCYQSVLLVDPAHDPALAAVAEIFRKARQYRELSQVLMLRAGGAVSPAFARDLRVEAADLLERHLGEGAAGRDLYRQVFEEDPGNDEAAARLLSAYERAGDVRAQSQLLERRAALLDGERRHATLCRLGDLELIELDDARSAARRYETVLAEDPASLDALRGAERAYRVTEQYERLVENLEQQLRLAVTARQKLELLRQIAATHAEQFLDHERATTTLERMLDVDRAHEPALVELSRHYRALGRFADVARVLERHVELIEDPKKRAVRLLELAHVLERQVGDTERAIGAYEAVRELEPREPTALDALARLRSTSGDERALDAIEAVAKNAIDATTRASHWARAARWLESRGQLEQAIVRYKRALGEADDPDAFSGLRAAYLKRGDRSSALELVERQIERVASGFAQAELWGVAAGLRRDLEDLPGAEKAAREALERDSTERGARTLLGDLAFDAGRFGEAARHYEPVVTAADAAEQPDAPRIHARYVEALSRQGERERALQFAEALASFAPDRLDGHKWVGELCFELQRYERVREVSEQMLERFGASLGERDHAAVLYRLGESLRLLGRLDEAGPRLERSADLDPEGVEPLRALCALYEAEQRWSELRSALERRVDRESGERRYATLVTLGDLLATRFADATDAAKRYLAALADRPKDRKVLLKLIELYSESRDWEHLIGVITELSEAADDSIQKARYLHTAARVAAEELKDDERSLALLLDALHNDPKLAIAVRDLIEVNRRLGDLVAVEHSLEQAITLASDAGDRAEALRLLEELANVAAGRDRIEKAVDAYEGAQRLDPTNATYAEKLTALYARDPKRYLERASEAQEAALRQDPYRPEPYHALSDLYTAARMPDAAWCACQALTVLGRAQPEEEAFFKKHRRDLAATSAGRLTDRDWTDLLVHPGADPLVTEIFALVEPCMLAVRGRSLRAYGLSSSGALTPSDHPHGLVRWLDESARVLGLELPLLIHDPKRAGALQLLPSRPRAIVLASAALNARLPDRRAAFVAAAHLVYVRSGLGARYLVPTVTGLKAWLLAALRILTPRLPIGAELEGPVADAQAAIAEHSTPGTRDRLVRPVGELLAQGARVDIARWVRAVDLTSDRAGLVVCDDLQTTLDTVRDAGDGANSVLAADRGKQLMRWSVSRKYVEIRERLGLSLVDLVPSVR